MLFVFVPFESTPFVVVVVVVVTGSLVVLLLLLAPFVDLKFYYFHSIILTNTQVVLNLFVFYYRSKVKMANYSLA